MSGVAASSSVVFEGVTKAFGSVTAVNDVSFQIEAGKLVTLLGPSGCGKTTTLRMIAGLEMPTSGRILIGGEDVSSLPATDRDVTMVFQSYALFPHMTVLQNVAYGLVVSGVAKREAHEQAEGSLAQVGLSGFGKRLPSDAEWEKAARGTQGQRAPWSDGGDVCDRAIVVARGCKRSGTSAVGSVPQGGSPYGAVDMLGNVWEWTDTPGQKAKNLRGGAFNKKQLPIEYLYAYKKTKSSATTGFRCAE